MKKQQMIGIITCLVTALIWGVTFIAQDVAAETVEPFTFQCTRSVLAAAVLIPAALVKYRVSARAGTLPPQFSRRKMFVGGAICGAILAGASLLQQFGISNDTDPGKSAFITALYIVFVPVLGLVLGKRAPWHVYLCTLAALGGLWLLCMGSASLSVGDIQVIACSFVFAVHILVVDRLVPYVDGIGLSAVQFATSALLSGIFMFVFERPTWEGILAAILPILFAGIFSSGVAYTLQIIGQQYTPPTVASLLFSLESVFAVLSGMVLLHTRPTPREFAGMAVIFAAIILSQLRFGERRRPKRPGDVP